jgi:hypothetical protein
MNNKKIFNVGNFKIELIVPDQTKDIRNSLENNINVFDENGELLWNISKLLKTYSDKNGVKYYDELYFDIRLLDNQNIFCIGFNNHCEIDLKTASIIKIVNNR